MDRMSLKAAKILGKPIKNELSAELDVDLIKQENDDDLDYASDQEEIENDLDEDEEIDELLKFPVSSSILDDQCSPTELNHLIHDSDSGSSHFDDGYLSSATSTNFNLNTNHQLLADGRRQAKSGNLLINNNQTNSTNDQLYQVHNYSCIKQDKFLHSANLSNQQLIANAGNQLIYLKHDGLLNGNYTSSNSSLSGGSNSSSPTQSPNARKSNYGRRPLNKSNDDQMKNGLRSNGSTANLNKIQQQQATGRGSRSKPITDLHLTDEERRLLNKEGYHDFPMGDNPQLSKLEEKILRKIRRKIRNKRSAQCSRQRKKEYLEELEKKYSKSTNELQCLKSEVLKLRKENFSLISKLQKFIRSVDQNATEPPIGGLSEQNSLGLSEQQLPEICGESLQINKFDTNEHQTQLGDLERSSGVCSGDHLETDQTDCPTEDGDKLDDLFSLLPSDQLEFDFEKFEKFDNFDHFEFDDLKDDGLIRCVNEYTNDHTQLDTQLVNNTDYHQQAPVKTSLFLLVLCFVLMFVPFLR